ncbi:MAG TPA: IPExxxVDY family protein [Cryomorphaceae bacterium]|nr:IPExxxVDY family protein [Cryomorphaceae bacterium]
MAKLTLELEDEYAFMAFGIVSTSKSHRVCWMLNKSLRLELKRDSDIEIFSKTKTSRHHAFFSFFDENLHIRYRLIENKKGVSLFLPEVKNADFLLVIDLSDEVERNDLIDKLRATETVLMAFEIDLELLRLKQNILLAA